MSSLAARTIAFSSAMVLLLGIYSVDATGEDEAPSRDDEIPIELRDTPKPPPPFIPQEVILPPVTKDVPLRRKGARIPLWKATYIENWEDYYVQVAANHQAPIREIPLKMTGDMVYIDLDGHISSNKDELKKRLVFMVVRTDTNLVVTDLQRGIARYASKYHHGSR